MNENFSIVSDSAIYKFWNFLWTLENAIENFCFQFLEKASQFLTASLKSYLQINLYHAVSPMMIIAFETTK